MKTIARFLLFLILLMFILIALQSCSRQPQYWYGKTTYQFDTLNCYHRITKGKNKPLCLDCGEKMIYLSTIKRK